MAILQLLFKDAKEYEKKDIVRIINLNNAKKDDDVVLVATLIKNDRGYKNERKNGYRRKSKKTNRTIA